MNVLVLAAHPDDEVLGCGGSLARHSEQGDNVLLVTMTNGESSRFTAPETDRRKLSLRKSCEVLGIRDCKSFDFADNALDKYPLLEIIQKVENDLISFNPSVVYTHSLSDLNIDHQICSKIAHTVFRPQPGKPCPEIRLFEVLSATHWGSSESPSFCPNLYIDISEHLNKKIEALSAYSDEMRPYPHARSVDSVISLSSFRGTTVGVANAEAFRVVRKVLKKKDRL